jgi:hypothetical protein
MNVFFDSNLRIASVDVGNGKGNGAFIHCPDSIKSVSVSHTVYTQKIDSLGRLLFLKSDGVEVISATTNYRENVPSMEPVVKTRQANLLSDPSSINVQDVINAKYNTLANGKQYWFDEFLDSSSLDDIHAAAFNVKCVQIPDGGFLTFHPIFTGDVKQLNVNIEAGDTYDFSGLSLQYSFDGGDTFIDGGPSIELSDTHNRFVFKLSNDTKSIIPVYSFSIFF